MRTSEFLDELRAQNILVFLDNGKVKVEANHNALTENLLSQLKDIKSEILSFLTNEEMFTNVDILEDPDIIAEREAIQFFSNEIFYYYPTVDVSDLSAETIRLINERCKQRDDEGRRNANSFTWTKASLF
jgi:hypothetical protein